MPPGEYDSEVLFQHLMRIAEVQFAAAAREREAITVESWPQRRAALRARLMEVEQVEALYRRTAEAYQRLGAPQALRIR